MSHAIETREEMATTKQLVRTTGIKHSVQPQVKHDINYNIERYRHIKMDQN